jgi:hypothetical protein
VDGGSVPTYGQPAPPFASEPAAPYAEPTAPLNIGPPAEGTPFNATSPAGQVPYAEPRPAFSRAPVDAPAPAVEPQAPFGAEPQAPFGTEPQAPFGAEPQAPFGAEPQAPFGEPPGPAGPAAVHGQGPRGASSGPAAPDAPHGPRMNGQEDWSAGGSIPPGPVSATASVPPPPAPPIVPAPLIPPTSPAPDARWAGGPWSDGTWSTGTSPSVDRAVGAFTANRAYPPGPAYPAGPTAPPPPPIPAGQPPLPGLRVPELPQRIPAPPDVPNLPGDEGVVEGAPAETPELARIATYLRDEERSEDRRDGFDFPAVIDAVLGVVGVQYAELVMVNDMHKLRLDLADDADPAEVSRAVARLLKEQMGVSAEPSQQATQPSQRATQPSQHATERAVEQDTTDTAGTATVESVTSPADSEPVRAEADAAPEAAVVEAASTGSGETSAPAEADDLDGFREPPELTMASEPVPPRLADLPRVGEAPTAADRVRLASVPHPPVTPRPRAGTRLSRARLADLEPEMSLDEWLEAIRPGRAARAEASTAGPSPQDDAEHRSLVGMPMAPVFTDPLAEPPAEERAEPSTAERAEPPTAEPVQPVDDSSSGGAFESGLQSQLLAPGAAPALQVAGAGGRVRLEQVEVANQGLDARVRVRLAADGEAVTGTADGPAVDQYVLRLCAEATGSALDMLLTDSETGVPSARCHVEHATVVSLGSCEVAVVVVLLAAGGWVEQLSGSAVVAGDSRQAVVRATLAAANRRLDALLP